MFCHSLVSDWNHGNAHFLRGTVRELLAQGHDVRVFEPYDAWSVTNLVADAGPEALDRFHAAYPGLSSTRYAAGTLDVDAALDGAAVVLVHEWNDPELVERIGRHRAGGGRYVLLFHDTHHRTVTDEAAMAAYDLQHYDGVLAFGEVIRDRYVRRGWARRAWTWHEAADVRLMHPVEGRDAPCEGDVIWVGNWGDDERSAEIREYLIEPVAALGLRATVHGVRYPAEARAALDAAGIAYRGWLPNYRVPEVFAAFHATVHIPRGPYVHALPGVPTIRVFEALACGIPLISCWWDDTEGLFRPADMLMVRTPAAMRTAMRDVLHDTALARSLAASGRATILARHTCGHRVRELLEIVTQVAGAPLEPITA
jgi:spore maturation protein CgeB